MNQNDYFSFQNIAKTLNYNTYIPYTRVSNTSFTPNRTSSDNTKCVRYDFAINVPQVEVEIKITDLKCNH